MYYFALLLTAEANTSPDPDTLAAEMAAYQAFHTKAASAIRAGDALTPSATGVRITGGADAPTITDGPFAEGAEVAGGSHVLDPANPDAAMEIAPQIPAAQHGAGQVCP